MTANGVRNWQGGDRGTTRDVAGNRGGYRCRARTPSAGECEQLVVVTGCQPATKMDDSKALSQVQTHTPEFPKKFHRQVHVFNRKSAGSL